MPRPRTLSSTRLAEAALAVIDRDGLQGFTMRSVAQELGTGVMSLYRYVENREQIERLVVDLVLGGISVELPEEQEWSERIMLLAERVREAVASHPSIVPLLLVHRHASASILRLGEAFLAALSAAGFEGTHRVVSFRALLSYLVGALQAEHLGPLSGPGTEALATLPVSEYPNLAATARAARSVAVEMEFREGLAAVLCGLKTYCGSSG